MTYEERQQLFAKDCLTIADIQSLLGLDYQSAAKIIRDIRRKSDRLGIQGMVHVQDYIDYFNLDITRYVPGTVAVIKGAPSVDNAENELTNTEPKPIKNNDGVPLMRSSQYLTN